MKEDYGGNDITNPTSFHLTTNQLNPHFKSLFPSARGLSKVKKSMSDGRNR